jgi:hypothetical protein
MRTMNVCPAFDKRSSATRPASRQRAVHAGFRQRACVELEATGEHARKRTVETRDDLTPKKHNSPRDAPVAR